MIRWVFKNKKKSAWISWHLIPAIQFQPSNDDHNFPISFPLAVANGPMIAPTPPAAACLYSGFGGSKPFWWKLISQHTAAKHIFPARFAGCCRLVLSISASLSIQCHPSNLQDWFPSSHRKLSGREPIKASQHQPWSGSGHANKTHVFLLPAPMKPLRKGIWCYLAEKLTWQMRSVIRGLEQEGWGCGESEKGEVLLRLLYLQASGSGCWFRTHKWKCFCRHHTTYRGLTTAVVPNFLAPGSTF